MDPTSLGNMLYICRTLRNYERQQTTAELLQPPEILLIHYIHSHPGSTQDAIARAAGMDKTTVAHRLDKLEKAGFVNREISEEDARRKLCTLTPKAEKLYPVLHEQYLRFNQGILEGLLPEELVILERLTTKMRQNAELLTAEQKEESKGKPLSERITALKSNKKTKSPQGKREENQ